MGKRSRRRGDLPVASASRAPVADQSLRERVRDSWGTASKIDDKTLAQARQRRSEARDRAARQGRRERPEGLFGPLPVSEFVIAMGIIVLVYGAIKGPEAGPNAFTIGIAMCTIAVIESTLREHLRGFRSHTLFISMLTMVLFHVLAAAIGGGDVGRSPALFVFDAVLFLGTAYWLLRAFRRAQRAAA